MELGSRPWLQAVMGAVNASDEYRDRAAGWRWPLALGFLDPPTTTTTGTASWTCTTASAAGRP